MPHLDSSSIPGSECTGLDTEGLAVLAHELRGALTVIAGYAELLKRGLPESDRFEAVGGISRAVERADGLLAAALSAEKTARESIPLTDVALVAEQVASEQRAATGRHIVVTATARPHVTLDADALSRALANLVSNAAKYSPQPTEVEVEVTQSEGAAIIEVSDRGPGIPAAEKDAVFEPFARLERNAEVPGTGLGLTVVKRVAESAGGSARVFDRDGGGATVRVELPLA